MRLRYRFPLVRDPEEYQRLLADMRRRCPTIAEAADHPLTEWEILHANALWDWLAGAVGVGICVGICIAFWLGAGTPSFFLCYLIFLLLPLQRHR
ncbi:MAG: hypothetical protein NTW86_11745, partial [Candidatus Sumerlaeota bacterium]|nr:hypothetical protein [Candidatus Sumerlaeota bacterium]